MSLKIHCDYDRSNKSRSLTSSSSKRTHDEADAAENSDGKKRRRPLHAESKDQLRKIILRTSTRTHIVAYKVQENKGQYYVHFGPHGVITSNSTAILMKLNNIFSQKALCNDGKSMSCAIHSACRGWLNDKIKDGVNEQRVMDASQEFVIADIGQQDCIADLTSMNKSSTKCHEEDEQLVAWDDVTGAMLDLDLVKEVRKA